MDQAMHMRGLTFRVHWNLVSVDPPHSAQWEGGVPAHSKALIRYELAERSGEPTTFRYTNEFHPPGGTTGQCRRPDDRRRHLRARGQQFTVASEGAARAS